MGCRYIVSLKGSIRYVECPTFRSFPLIHFSYVPCRTYCVFMFVSRNSHHGTNPRLQKQNPRRAFDRQQVMVKFPLHKIRQEVTTRLRFFVFRAEKNEINAGTPFISKKAIIVPVHPCWHVGKLPFFRDSVLSPPLQLFHVS